MTTLAPIFIPSPNVINIIPDTSWLLDRQSQVGRMGYGVDGFSTQLFTKTPNAERGFLGTLFGEDAEVIQPYAVAHTWILLEEVLAEIATLHAKAAEKRQGTAHAKLLLRDIMEKTTFERVSGKEFEPIDLLEGSLGLDSKVDHFLLTVAIQRSKTWKSGISIILTNDSGLILEASSQKRENKYNLATSVDGEDLRKVTALHLFNSPFQPIPARLHPTTTCAWTECFKREDFQR